MNFWLFWNIFTYALNTFTSLISLFYLCFFVSGLILYFYMELETKKIVKYDNNNVSL